MCVSVCCVSVCYVCVSCVFHVRLVLASVVGHVCVCALFAVCVCAHTHPPTHNPPPPPSLPRLPTHTHTKVPSNERKRLFGRKKSGVALPLSSTFHNYKSSLVRGLGEEQGTEKNAENEKSRYTVVMSERGGDVQEIEVR